MRCFVLAFALALAAGTSTSILVGDRGDRVNFTYHNYDDVTGVLRRLVRSYPELTSLYSIGRTSQNRELWVLRITSQESSILGTPNLKFIGNIHGNEPVGKELILHLAEYLLKNYYSNDSEVKWLLDKTIIHLLPSLNPDGFETAVEGDCDSTSGRGNGNLVDLNRSFPDFFRENPVPEQPETKAIIRWLEKVPFVLSASFHGGTLVANYPYENDGESGVTPKYSSSPDDDTFRYLAEVYSRNHAKMHRGVVCRGDVSVFPGGITNGAAWYKITGGMQDYNYVWHGCMELTLEISCCKYPSSQHLPRLWNENRKSILEWAKKIHLGVRGLVMDSTTGRGLPRAILSVVNRNINFTSSQTGEFWRILLPGDYVMKVQASGYQTQFFPFTVRRTNETYPEATWLNLYLRPGNASETKPTGSGFRPNKTSPGVRFFNVYAALMSLLSFLQPNFQVGRILA